MGVRLFPWQQGVLRAWCSRDESDRPAYVTCGLSVPRQNGKNVIIEALELYALAVSAWHILHTAHLTKTSKKSFRRLVKYFTDKRHPELVALVDTIRYTNGEEAIYLTNGGSIEFSARTRGATRGFDDIQLVVWDEAQELTDEQVEAIMYTLSASSTGERIMVYTGTPPGPKAPGEVFRHQRRQALKGGSHRACWDEWCVDGCPRRDVVFDDVLDSVYECNPSMGYTLSEEWTRTEFENSGDIAGFARERLGWWESDSAGETRAIDAGKWAAAQSDTHGEGYDGRTAFAVKFSPDGATYALAGCRLDKPGRGRAARAVVELVEVGGTRGGTSGLAKWLLKRKATASTVVVDGLSNSGALLDNLKELRAPRGYVTRPRPGDVVAAATMLRDKLDEGTLAHTGQDDLTRSATGAVRRPIGTSGGWGFGSTEDADATAIEAASLALWGARTSRRDPKRRQMIL